LTLKTGGTFSIPSFLNPHGPAISACEKPF
jgi:hypothetical protein